MDLPQITATSRVDNVRYAIRGPIMDAVNELEKQGKEVLKLNIGDPAPFGFSAPQHIVDAISENLHHAHGYISSVGTFEARKSIANYYAKLGIEDIKVDDILIGNGVSDLILLATQALLSDGDEVLVPSPDYPLWTAAVNLNGGIAKHYPCIEEDEWQPDTDSIEKMITPNTKAIVVINPNNPTGAVYGKDCLSRIVELAERHNLVIFSDEIYDQVLFDGAKHIPTATLSKNVMTITFGGLSKNHRLTGYRAGWMALCGKTDHATPYISALKLLSSLRLGPNAPIQYAIQAALNEPETISELTQKGGRLYEQMDYVYRRLNAIDGVSCQKARGAMYLFPKLDMAMFGISNDSELTLKLLNDKHVLLVGGTGFNWSKPDHLRFVCLPPISILEEAMDRFEDFLNLLRQGKNNNLSVVLDVA